MSKKREKLVSLLGKALKDDSLPLKEGANKLVFGNGTAEAKIVLIGEGPGYNEAIQGIPFCGRAGALLNQVLARIGLSREEVFTTNVVMYRPPNNRDPEPHEIKAFAKYVDGIIDIIKPEVIVTLGRFSMAKFLGEVKISQVHGSPRIVNWKDRKITVMPMYHPAAALRNGNIKSLFVSDFDKLEALLQKQSEDVTLVEENENSREEDSPEQISLL